jgi:RimJ/RimL family protein N-acetyltransferase
MELSPTYPVRSARLSLRPLSASDTEAMLAYRSRPDVCRYVPFDPMDAAIITERLATVWVRTSLDDVGQNLTLGVEITATGDLVGDVVLFWHSREHRGGEVGYVLNPAFGGHGYATEAVQTLLGLAFDGLGLHRVIARIDARNDASARLAERLGMRQEAHLRSNEWFKGEWTDELDFALLEDEWAARSPAHSWPRTRSEAN